MITLTRTTSENLDFQQLVAQLDAVLRIADGEEHAFFAQYNKIDSIKNVVVCYENNMAVSCGAFKLYETNVAEIKRMFVLPEQRGKGFAKAILTELENWAKELHFDTCILETSTRLPEAVGLYLKSGYEITENYGQYIGVETSVCMKKNI